MKQTIYTEAPAFRSRLSFQPLVSMWEVTSVLQKDQTSLICQNLCQRFAAHPELLKPIDDYNILERHRELIEEGITTVLPVSIHLKKQLHAVTAPFSNKVIHASLYFRRSFMDEKNQYVLPLDEQVVDNINRARINLAYKMILKKFYHIELSGGYSFLCAYPDPRQNIHNYFEMTWDPGFTDISYNDPLPSLPAGFALNCHHVDDLVRFPDLKTILPLDQFIFDGLFIVSIEEVTQRETVNKIRDMLDHDQVFENNDLFNAFALQLKYLLRNEQLDILAAPFSSGLISLMRPQHFGLFMANPEEKMQKELCDLLIQKLEVDRFYFCPGEDGTNDPVFRVLSGQGWKSAIFFGLYLQKRLIGTLGILSRYKIRDERLFIASIQPLIPQVQVALRRNMDHVQHQVNRIVKDHFTAVHASVEWSFNDAAINFLSHMGKGEHPKMEPILFRDVFPLYGVLDIRNSSLERNHAIQNDILSQLDMVRGIIEMARKQLSLPILDEWQSRVQTWTDTVKNFLFSSDEQAIYSFLQIEVPEFLQHLNEVTPGLAEETGHYLQEAGRSMLVNIHQSEFNETVTTINNQISGFLEKEQPAAQLMYPHYFERFVTDGVEFNMYVGQSICPQKKFNLLFLRNLRLWQLKTMALAAQHVHRLCRELPVQLETTQLILAYHHPISIRFRNAERKFDLDGVNHARYEIIKKRIEKALIKNTNERLTCPGTIAIVYTHEKEALEYGRYIDFLKREDLFTGEIEKLDIEELQGISGLKSLRVRITTEERTVTAPPRLKKKLHN